MWNRCLRVYELSECAGEDLVATRVASLEIRETASGQGVLAPSPAYRGGIAERQDQRERQAHHAGRKPRFDRNAYKQRHIAGDCVGRLKKNCGSATRYENSRCTISRS